jgi:nucleotide-binding universal stress UspA family protein
MINAAGPIDILVNNAVVRHPSPIEDFAPATWNEIEGGARAAAQKSLKALVRRAQRAGLVATSLLTEGSAAEQIVKSAKAKRADLLVIGTHGRSGFARLLLGSVAAHVVATAPCPVLTVRRA